MSAYLSNFSYEEEQKQRTQLLNVEQADIQSLAKYIRAFMKADCLCVVGNEDKITEAETLFEKTSNLL